MKREEIIKELIEHDLDGIWYYDAEKCVAGMLRRGVEGYDEQTDQDLEDTYNDTFRDNEGDEPITIEKE